MKDAGLRDQVTVRSTERGTVIEVVATWGARFARTMLRPVTEDEARRIWRENPYTFDSVQKEEGQ